MKARTIKQAKRRVAMRLLFILTIAFLMGIAVGATAGMLVAVNCGLI